MFQTILNEKYLLPLNAALPVRKPIAVRANQAAIPREVIRQHIVSILADNVERSATELATLTGGSKSAVYATLTGMISFGCITRRALEKRDHFQLPRALYRAAQSV